jgi:hypothetical protein
MHIFLDESGQFTKHNNEQYFIIGSFTVGSPRRTDKALRAWFRTKFPRKMCTQSEIKWSQTGIDDSLRLKTIKYISGLDIRIRYGYLLRNNIPTTYRKKNKIESGRLYTNIVGDVLEDYLPADDKEIHIFCDRRHLKGMRRQDFEHDINSRLIPRCAPNTRIQVEMVDSTLNANMQIADWISGALARYLEKGKMGDDFLKILKNNLLSDGKEFFK